MRCRSCDCELSDAESAHKDEATNEYEDLCFTCLGISSKAAKDECVDVFEITEVEFKFTNGEKEANE